MSKYDDYRRVDNRYTTAIGMSSWRFFNVGKYKNQKVKDVCYFNPFYVAWCLENWQGFSLTSYERSNYMKGLERQLEKDPEDQELILKVSKCKGVWHRKVDSFTCNNIFVRFITAYPPVTGVAS